MKRFLAIYIGTEAALERAGWNELDERSASLSRPRALRPGWTGDRPTPPPSSTGRSLGKTKRASHRALRHQEQP